MNGAVTSCVGKIPVHGDFVRLNHSEVPEIVELDRWLLEGMERAYEGRGRAFEADLRSLSPSRFLFVSPVTKRLFAGVITASADKVGRSYPLAIGFRIEAPAPGPGYDRLPVALDQSLTGAIELAASGKQGGELSTFLAAVQALPFQQDDRGAEQSLRSYLLGTTLEALLGNWPGFQSAERRSTFLRELRQVVGPPFPPRYVASLPTHGDSHEVGFWLTLVRQWLPIRVNPVLLAWPAGTGALSSIRILFDDLHPRYFEPVFWPERDTDSRLDLARPWVGRRSAEAPAAPGPSAAELRPRSLLHDVILAAGRS